MHLVGRQWIWTAASHSNDKDQLGTCQNKIGNPFIDTLVQRMQIAITLEQLREECLEPKLRGLG